MIGIRAQVDHRRGLDELAAQASWRSRAAMDLINEALGDQLAAGQLLIATTLRVLRRRPALQRTRAAAALGRALRPSCPSCPQNHAIYR